jgi:hypothetical protein
VDAITHVHGEVSLIVSVERTIIRQKVRKGKEAIHPTEMHVSVSPYSSDFLLNLFAIAFLF